MRTEDYGDKYEFEHEISPIVKERARINQCHFFGGGGDGGCDSRHHFTASFRNIVEGKGSFRSNSNFIILPSEEVLLQFK